MRPRWTRPPANLDALEAHYNNHATVIKADVVGPTVGKQLEKQALLATLYSMGACWSISGFRFQLIYGVAAVVACFHDTLDHRRRLRAHQPGDQPDGGCGDPDPGGLLDERHHRLSSTASARTCAWTRRRVAA